VAVYKIADGGAKKELVAEFGTNGHEWSGDVAYTKYYKSENGEKKDITEAEYNALCERYGKYLDAKVTKERSGLEFTSLYTENELVQAVYRLVLRDYILVRDADTKEDSPLSAYKINNKPLSEIDGATYSYVDLDGDSIFELVIDCGEALVLRATKEAVYVYPFVTHKMRDLETDGSYYHSNTENGFEYGESKLYIEGDELKTKEIWRIVGDGERYAERGEAFYYIEGREVARNELLRYYNNIRGKFENTEKIPLVFVNKLPISSESAWKTASEHFGVKDGAQDGAAGTLMTHRIVLLSKPTPDKAYYHFGYVIESKGSSFLGADALPAQEVRIYKEAYVDALTGNCFDVNKYDPDGKG